MITNPHSHAPAFSGTSFQNPGGYYSNKKGLKLKWNVQKQIYGCDGQGSTNVCPYTLTIWLPSRHSQFEFEG